jgi:hypothetical protein
MQSLPQAFNLQVLRHKCISCHAVQAALAMEAGNDWIFDGLLVLLEQLVLMPIVVVDREGHSPSPPGQKLAPELVVDTANLLQKVHAHTNLVCWASAFNNTKPNNAGLSCNSICAGCTVDNRAASQYGAAGETTIHQ